MRSVDSRPDLPTSPHVRGGKRAAVLRAARELFLRDGFVGTSVDSVTAAAGVSKPTVYSHFPTKEALLEAVLRDAPPGMGAPAQFPATGDARSDLERAARALAALARSPESLAWDRLASAEAGRRPDLAALYFDRGPGVVLGLLADLFRSLESSGALTVGDPVRAAEFFFGLAAGTPLLRLRLGVDPTAADERCERDIAALFLRGVGTDAD